MYQISASPRLRFEAIPAPLLQQIGRALGAFPVDGATIATGFSGGFAGRVELGDGRRVFVKAVSDAHNPVAFRDYHAEATIVGRLPAELPVPELLETVESEVNGIGWVAVVYRCLDGRPPSPQRPGDLDLVIELTATLAAVDPAPLPGLPQMADDAGTFGRWDHAAGPFEGYPRWLAEHEDRLRSAASHWRTALTGTALLHGDLRLDNMVVAEGRAWAVDWPKASTGAAFFDALLIGPALELLPGAPDLASWIDRHPVLRCTPDAAVETVAAATLGYFVTSSVLPAPVGLPTIREFQRGQAEALISWFARRWT